jgi:hypothetical protein
MPPIEIVYRLVRHIYNPRVLGRSDEIAVEQLAESIIKRDILDMEQLEKEVKIYLDDFSRLVVAWKFNPSLPFLCL